MLKSGTVSWTFTIVLIKAYHALDTSAVESALLLEGGE